MFRLGITTLGLLVLGAVFYVAQLDAQSQQAAEKMSRAAEAQSMGPELEKLLAVTGRPVLSMSFDDDGEYTPFVAGGVSTREMDDPVPPEAHDVKLFTIYYYRKNPHCYSYWTGSKWMEVCPVH